MATYWVPNIRSLLTTTLYATVNGLLYWVVSDEKHGEYFQLLLPSSLRKQVLEGAHDSMGHQGTAVAEAKVLLGRNA